MSNDRKVFLDTETTGMGVRQGHRVIEIAALECLGDTCTNNYFHTYLNSGKPVDKYAYRVHGISDSFLRNKPTFKEKVNDFCDFLRDSTVYIHNASFDVAFIDNELKLSGSKETLKSLCFEVVDTLKLARDKFPKQKNDLDTLRNRLNIQMPARNKHSAKEDVRLLWEIYIKLVEPVSVEITDYLEEYQKKV